MKLKYDAAFSMIRQMSGLQADFLEQSGFAFSKLKAGGGKGGDLMAFTSDNKYLVKEVALLLCGQCVLNEAAGQG